jgi:CheY-like chemotaxis protein
MPVRCLIVDDNPRFVEAATELLADEGIDVVGVAPGGEAAARLARELHPDLALIDIDLGPESGFDVARGLHAGGFAGAVILISTHAEDQFAEMIAASPAIGFLAKAELSTDAIEALLSRPAQERAE